MVSPVADRVQSVRLPPTFAGSSETGGFIGTLRLSECTGKNRMVCTITMAGVEELESRELL